jgi:hypothetical protein
MMTTMGGVVACRAAAAPRPVVTGALSGRVCVDADLSTWCESREAGIANVQVRIVRVPTGGRKAHCPGDRADFGPALAAMVVTDAGGEYVAPGLPAGWYCVIVHEDEHIASPTPTSHLWWRPVWVDDSHGALLDFGVTGAWPTSATPMASATKALPPAGGERQGGLITEGAAAEHQSVMVVLAATNCDELLARVDAEKAVRLTVIGLHNLLVDRMYDGEAMPEEMRTLLSDSVCTTERDFDSLCARHQRCAARC